MLSNFILLNLTFFCILNLSFSFVERYKLQTKKRLSLFCNSPTPRRKMSWPLDFIDASPVLDGSLAGDAGFDPLGVAKDTDSLFVLREAEIKHARLFDLKMKFQECLT